MCCYSRTPCLHNSGMPLSQTLKPLFPDHDTKSTFLIKIINTFWRSAIGVVISHTLNEVNMFNIYLRSFASKMQVLKTSYNCDDFILRFNWDELLRGDFFASKPYSHFFYLFLHGKYWSAPINIRSSKGLVNLRKSSRMQKKFGLQ